MSAEAGEKSHGCHVCGKRFRYPSQLKLHQSVHSTARPYPCEQCGCTFKYTSSLAEHARTHAEPQPFVCDTCGRRFAHRSNARVHAALHEPDDGDGRSRRFRCDKCPAAYNYRSNLREHIAAQHGCVGQLTLLRPPYRCVKCGKVYKYRNSLLDHQRGHKRRRLHRPHKCNICTLAFVEEETLRLHVANHKPGDERRFACPNPECQRAFPRRSQLALHAVVHAFERRHACGQCGRGFHLRKCLNQHLGRVHGDPRHAVPMLGCPRCRRLVKGAGGLRTHMATHAVRQRLQCQHCDRKFLRGISLQRHCAAVHNVLQTQQQKPDEQPQQPQQGCPRQLHVSMRHRFECQDCGKLFAQRYNLQRHQRSLHGVVAVAAPEFQCADCGAKCRDAEKLAEHARLHVRRGRGGTGNSVVDDRPFTCGRCRMRFRWRRNLTDHAARAHGGGAEAAVQKPHQCGLCGKSFAQRSQLATHALVHSEERPFRCGRCGAAYKHRKNLDGHVRRVHEPILTDTDSDSATTSDADK